MNEPKQINADINWLETKLAELKEKHNQIGFEIRMVVAQLEALKAQRDQGQQ